MFRQHLLVATVAVVAVLCLGAACKSRTDTSEPSAPAATGAPARESRLFSYDRKCMGTLCLIKVWHNDAGKVETACRKALGEFDRVERLMSEWRDDSELTRINQAAGSEAVEVSEDTLLVIKKGVELGVLTEGHFDITVGAFHGLWKFDEDKDGTLPSPDEVKARLALVDYRDIQIDEAAHTVKLKRAGQRLTLGGIAKGYAVDAAVAVLREAGIRDFIVQAGGDLFAGGRRGDRQWMVGVQDPRRPRGEIIYKLSLSDRAFNTSGDYERFVIESGRRYHHILDAKTGFPVEHTRAVTLLATSAFKADLLDTAVFTMGWEKAMAVVEADAEVEAIIVDAKNQVHVSSGLTDLVKVADPTDGL